MSAPAENGNKLITISFTALLYGVVIDAALHRLHRLEFTPANLLLVIALILVIQDFFFYHEDMKALNLKFTKEVRDGASARRSDRLAAEKTRRRKERKIFVFDVLLLGSWYALSLAAHSAIPTYLTALTAFFLSVALWDTFACPPTAGDKFREWLRQGKLGPWFIRSHWPITVLTAGVAVAAYQLLEFPVAAHEPAPESEFYQSFADWSSTARLLLAVPLGVFLLWRVYYWHKTRQQMESDLNDTIDFVAPVPDAGPTERLDLFVNGGFVEVRGRVPIPTVTAPNTGSGGA